ncbi:hypothetical protein M422DRAFT_248175 [Sphaerobolus stellatus SS14]|uniref:Uncharacterized protein n=1 Tax=Sphaerobolus stellatus (strain SS14) TaxID=990650 RepID=A0A0C9VJ69_SPHS4|nr:hypothetical protein M422DRAFT_248175 [Sphaerobolus stellatus SS14]
MLLLPIATASTAHQQFVKSRLGDVDSTASQDFNTARSLIQKNWVFFAALIIGASSLMSATAAPASAMPSPLLFSLRGLRAPINSYTTPPLRSQWINTAWPGLAASLAGMQASRVICRGRRSRIIPAPANRNIILPRYLSERGIKL